MPKDITEHARCPFSEIPDFLNETETTRLLELAESGRLENSDVFHNSVDTLLSQNSFEYWDLNRDDVINTDEVHNYISYPTPLTVIPWNIQRVTCIFLVYTLSSWRLVYIPRKYNWLVRYVIHGITPKSVSCSHRKGSSQHIQCQIRTTDDEKA